MEAQLAAAELLAGPIDVIAASNAWGITGLVALVGLISAAGAFIFHLLAQRSRGLEARYAAAVAEWRKTLRRDMPQGGSLEFQVNRSGLGPQPSTPPNPPRLSSDQIVAWRNIAITIVAFLAATALVPYAIKAVVGLLQPLPPGAALIVGVLVAVGLFWLKKKKQITYGALECIAGAVTMWVIVTQPPNPDQLLAQAVGFAAAVYVIVRGIGNAEEGLKKAGLSLTLTRIENA